MTSDEIKQEDRRYIECPFCLISSVDRNHAPQDCLRRIKDGCDEWDSPAAMAIHTAFEAGLLHGARMTKAASVEMARLMREDSDHD